jgi:hypothetical protein
VRRALAFIAEAFCRHRLIADRVDKTSPYLSRYYLLGNKKSRWFLALHLIHKSDADAHMHSHPFSWFAMMLSGFYYEVQPSGTYKRRAGFFRVRWSRSWHRLVLPAGPCWTLFFGFARKGSWYFLVDGKPVERRAYGVLDD